MYQFHQNILTVPARALYEELGVMSKPNYDRLCRAGKLNSVRTAGGLGNTALIEFHSIPERFKPQIIEAWGAPPKEDDKNELLSYYKPDYQAQDFYANYILSETGDRTLSPEVQNEYTINAQMLQAIDLYIKHRVMFRKSRNGKARLTQTWESVAESLKEIQVKHTLPTSVRRLKQKFDAFGKEGYSALISDNFGNRKAIKVKDSVQEAVLRQILRDHRNLDDEQTARVYNSVAKVQDWKPITAGTVANYRKKWKLLIYAGSKGEKGFDNHIAMQVKRKAPSAPLLYWTVDGWDAELLYQNNGIYHQRLTIVVVLDPSLKYPIGYAIGETENAKLIQAAVRNAVKHTEELFGKKHKVMQLQSDNYSKKKMMPVYEIMSDRFTPAKVGNAKSKVIEPWFNYFNRNYCQFASNWSGCNVTSKRQPNAEYLNRLRHYQPDSKGCEAQLIRMIEQERERLKDDFIRAYREAPADAKKIISDTEYLRTFGETTGYTNRLGHNGVHITINGEKLEYDSFDLNFRMYSHLDWTIKFDTDNLQEVLAYSEEKQISFMLTKKHVQPMALYDRQEGDSDELQKVFNFNREAKKYVIDYVADDSRITSQPEIKDTLSKLLLVDDKGQHKDNRNKIRLDNARKILEKQEKKNKKEAEYSWDAEQNEYLTSKTDFNKYLQT